MPLNDCVCLVVKATLDNELTAKAEIAATIEAKRYTGETTVMPQTFEQVLKTSGLLMPDDITVQRIPTYSVSNKTGTTFIIGELNGNQ